MSYPAFLLPCQPDARLLIWAITLFSVALKSQPLPYYITLFCVALMSQPLPFFSVLARVLTNVSAFILLGFSSFVLVFYFLSGSPEALTIVLSFISPSVFSSFRTVSSTTVSPRALPSFSAFTLASVSPSVSPYTSSLSARAFISALVFISSSVLLSVFVHTSARVTASQMTISSIFASANVSLVCWAFHLQCYWPISLSKD